MSRSRADVANSSLASTRSSSARMASAGAGRAPAAAGSLRCPGRCSLNGPPACCALRKSRSGRPVALVAVLGRATRGIEPPSGRYGVSRYFTWAAAARTARLRRHRPCRSDAARGKPLWASEAAPDRPHRPCPRTTRTSLPAFPTIGARSGSGWRPMRPSAELCADYETCVVHLHSLSPATTPRLRARGGRVPRNGARTRTGNRPRHAPTSGNDWRTEKVWSNPA
jgi:hypothetical protein